MKASSNPLLYNGIGYGLTEYDFVTANIFAQITGKPYSTCIMVDDGILDFSGYRAARIDQSIDKKYSYDWTEAAMTAALRLEAKVAGFEVASASVETRYRAANVNTKISYGTSTDFIAELGTRFLKEFKFRTGEGATVAKKLNELSTKMRTAGDSERSNLQKQYELASLAFYLLCGDRFVFQSSLGARFSSAVRVHFKDNRALLDFFVKAKAKVMKLEKTQTEYEHYDRHLTDSVVEVDIFQAGGDESEYNNLLKSLGGKDPNSRGSYRSRCFIEAFNFTNEVEFQQNVSRQLELCYSSWALVNAYLKNDFYRQVGVRDTKGQLDGKKLNSLAVETFHSATYESVGLLDSPLAIPISVKKNLDILNRILREYNKLKLLVGSLENAESRSALAVTVNSGWKDIAQGLQGGSAFAQKGLALAESLGKACLQSIVTGSDSPCKDILADPNYRNIIGNLDSYTLKWGT
jgi:hypothetical protein